jgi:hypothetical protein
MIDDCDESNPYESSAERLTKIVGWVCKKCKRYWANDEHMARYCCASSMPCDCGKRRSKHRTVCPEYLAVLVYNRWLAMPEVEWNGTTMLCVYDDDEFLMDEDDLATYLSEHDLTVEDVQLVVCVENHAPHFEMGEFLCCRRKVTC